MSGFIEDIQDMETDMDEQPDNTRIQFNIGGTLQQTFLGTLRRFPQSRLCQLATESVSSTLESTNEDNSKSFSLSELFLDRDPRLFAVILNFYRTGELHIPNDICGPAMKKELDYWGVEELDMEPCCWMNYSTFADTSATLEEFERNRLEEEIAMCIKARRTHSLPWRMRLYKFLIDPYSSNTAKLYAWLMLVVVFISILVYCLETLPNFTKAEQGSYVELVQTDYQLFHGKIYGFYVLVLIDNVCNAIFLTEFLVRLAVAPNRCRFLMLPLSLIEILSILPYYIALTISATSSQPGKYSTILNILFLFRVLRILRIFALMKHFQALKILVYTLRASTQELLLLVLILSLGMLLFASLMFQAERDEGEPKQFKHVFDALWWALITMTTVGYGDMVPHTSWGFAIGSLCATSGILVIALTVPIIVNNFTLYYSHAQSKQKLCNRREEVQERYLIINPQTPEYFMCPKSIKKQRLVLSFKNIHAEENDMDVCKRKQESTPSVPPTASNTSLVKKKEHGSCISILSTKVAPEEVIRLEH